MSGPLVSASAAFVAKNSRITPYAIEQSLRFDGSSHLNFTPSSSASTRRQMTFSFWSKHDGTYNIDNVFSSGTGSYYDAIVFDSTTCASAIANSGATGLGAVLYPAARLRDPSAWLHYVMVLDTPNATAADRLRIYINGERVSDFASSPYAADADPGQNYDTKYWNTTATHRLGSAAYSGSADRFFSGYLAEVHCVFGSALDPTSFGEYDDNGVWRPIEYTGSYGTNGFYLKFDPTATNGIGHDHSGNGNNWTASGFITSGTGTDVMSDTPTNNFCTMNPLFPSGAALSNGNLYGYLTSDGVTGTIGPTSGKWYFETTVESLTTNAYIGIADDTLFKGDSSFTYSQTYLYLATGVKGGNGSTDSYGSTYGAGDIIGVAFDLDTPSIRFYKNGVDQGEAYNSINNTGSSYRPFAWTQGGGHTYNFGQREFAYPPGTASATDYFNVVTYTGNGSTQSITGVGFQPDFVWIKKRDTNGNHMLTDVVRGANTEINSNTTAAEISNTNALTSFDTDGFSVGADGAVNASGEGLVAWCWKAGGTASSNTDGSITSSVSANQDAGFSIVSYVANGTSTQGSTVGHGLGVAPKFIIAKDRDASQNWFAYSEAYPGAAGGYNFNTSQAAFTSDAGYWNSTAPTSTVFTIGNYHGYTGEHDMIAYCFAEVEGYSKFGSYTGNGSTTGPFIECGFKPRMVMVKRTDAASNWFMYDTIRGTNNKLYADSLEEDNGEDGGSTTSNTILSLSNGFQMTSGNGSNASGGTYIFMAWAENFSADATYKALNSANLPEPDIKDGSKHFSANTWTGNGTTNNALTGFGHQPDFVWGKARSQAYAHALFDSIRGGGYRVYNTGSTPPAQDYLAEYIKSFDSDGITLGSDANLNGNNVTYAGWSWKGGGTVSAGNNTDGTITTTVSANPTGGFSVIKYTSNGTSGATIGHGLGVAPAFFIVKNIDATDHYSVYHQSLGNTKALLLNSSNTPYTDIAFWNNTSPSSTVITLGNETSTNNSSSDDYICWAWAEVEGYSKFGSYTGNGSSDGPFVYCGFKPAWLMVKKDAASTDWKIYDAGREPYNVISARLAANTAGAELSGNAQEIDFLSNGFKFRGTNGDQNSSGTFYYAVFGSNPFGGSGVNPATAR